MDSVTGISAGPGPRLPVDAGGPILVDGAEHRARWSPAATRWPGSAAGVVTRAPRHRHLRPAEVVERMAEGVDASVLHQGDGAGGPPWPDRPGSGSRRRGSPGSRGPVVPSTALLAGAQAAHRSGTRTSGVERGPPEVVNLRREAAQDQRRRDGPQQGADASPRPSGGRPAPRTSPGRRANGSRGRRAPATTSTSAARVTACAGGGSGVDRRRAACSGVASVAAISSIGVMPAIASRENAPSAYETAPTSRSSM